ncbi:PREDICTED: tankyrase-2-like [Acropora digitifera]|uniref:tankyrase-2-like n=1 Tax=Acropora digitifera TaxID=70779 RepID=UPI00077A2205|nr:PREDICTED: tankyrase-2-like [Acropora digitifera]
MHKSKSNEEKKALATPGNSTSGGYGGEGDGTPSFAQQTVLDQGTSNIEMATAAGHEEVPVKQEDTDWMIRKKNAIASRSAIHKASVNGQYEKVKKYLSSGCAVDVKDQFLLTPLHLACWYGQESVVKLLLEYGADVNATDKFQFTPLHKAERRNHHSIVKLLLDLKARPTLQQPPSLRRLGRRAFTRTDEHSGFNVLQAAVLEGDVDTVRKASVHLENFVEEMKSRKIGEKAPIFAGESAADIFSAFKDKRKSHSLIGKIYKEFVEIDVTLTALHSCAKRNDVEMAIELVLNDGMDVNVAAKRNITPLLWARYPTINPVLEKPFSLMSYTISIDVSCMYELWK